MRVGLHSCLGMNLNRSHFQITLNCIPYKQTEIIKRLIMKKIFFLILLAATSFQLYAQRYAVIDTRYILSKLPEYKTAQDKLNAFSAQWQLEIDEKQAALDILYRNFEGEKLMLSEELLKKREDDIFTIQFFCDQYSNEKHKLILMPKHKEDYILKEIPIKENELKINKPFIFLILTTPQYFDDGHASWCEVAANETPEKIYEKNKIQHFFVFEMTIEE